MESHSPASWNSLPSEIRLDILELVAHEKPPGWVSLASVCKQWQTVFEKENYKKLKIRSSRLGEFKSMVPPQKRHLIRHLWFDIELRRYNTRCCTKRSSLLMTMGPTVSKAIRRIFSILSTWEKGDELTLELNVVCHSDSEHWFQHLHFSSDCVDNDEKSARRYADYHHDDPHHGWVHGAQLELPPSSALYQLAYPITLDDFEFDYPLPTVKAVTHLVIRRQLRRRIIAFSLLELLKRLPCLESIVFERWLTTNRSWSELDDEYLSFVVQQLLPKTVKRLVMFQESTEFYDTLPQLTGQTRHLGYHDRYDLGFAIKSQELDHLIVSFMVDADHMFQLCHPTWTWPNLQTLSLTSQLLQRDDKKRGAIEELLVRAGNLVQNMPKMRTLVLWNGGKGHACAFIYRVHGNDYPSITWRGTWDLEMGSRIIESWQDVASTFPSCMLDVRNEHIGETIGSHGDAIHYLRLPLQVVEPASLWQMRKEARGNTLY